MFKPAIANLLAQSIPDPNELVAWIVAAVIVVLGLLIFGFGDLLRFRPRRVRALASVCFRESVRRRVLWITPLAILAVIIISQLQRPTDEQDAIRQTLKFCLFATGALVAVTGVILACTNLPKEIETRVIYTIVTKPTTRLEIVLGKIAGFAAVSGTILLIMGVFTYAYLHGRAWSLMSDVDQRLAQASQVDPATGMPRDPGLLATLTHYKNSGLLTAESLKHAADLQVYSRPAKPDAKVHYISGGGQGEFIVPYQLSANDLVPEGIPGAAPGSAGLLIQLNIGYEAGPASQDAGGAVSTEETEGPSGPKILAPKAATMPSRVPRTVTIELLDLGFNPFVPPNLINDGNPIRITDPTGVQPAIVPIAPAAIAELAKGTPFYLRVTGDNRNTDYVVGETPVALLVPGATPQQTRVILPNTSSDKSLVKWPRMRTRSTSSEEQQVRGSPVDAAPSPDRPVFAVYRFRDAAANTSGEEVSFELKGRIERSGAESDLETPTYLQVVAIPISSGEPSQPVTVQPESNRVSFIKFPKAALGGGDFDIQVRCTTAGHFMNLKDTSLTVATDSEPFAVNLFKSLAILWLLSILVVVISIFCSTFLSWPIAIVLTIVILLGHWGVQQLGDVLAPGIGNTVVTDMFGSKVDANVAKTVSTSVEALSKGLALLSLVLPDITRFSAIEDIERGLTIPVVRLVESLKVLLMFGLPMTVLSYVFLRNKEVAP